jgi:hypothetical protein
MKLQTIRNLLDNTDGRFFTVQFEKQNGDLRVMNCRGGVRRYLKGGTNNMEDKPQYYTVFDVRRKSYRTINLSTIQNIRIDGVTMNFAK